MKIFNFFNKNHSLDYMNVNFNDTTKLTKYFDTTYYNSFISFESELNFENLYTNYFIQLNINIKKKKKKFILDFFIKKNLLFWFFYYRNILKLYLLKFIFFNFFFLVQFFCNKKFFYNSLFLLQYFEKKKKINFLLNFLEKFKLFNENLNIMKKSKLIFFVSYNNTFFFYDFFYFLFLKFFITFKSNNLETFNFKTGFNNSVLIFIIKNLVFFNYKLHLWFINYTFKYMVEIIKIFFNFKIFFSKKLLLIKKIFCFSILTKYTFLKIYKKKQKILNLFSTNFLFVLFEEYFFLSTFFYSFYWTTKFLLLYFSHNYNIFLNKNLMYWRY